MADFLASMTVPFLACLVLAGIHCYLGIHVISRKVIFVDLALAQIAALGAVFAMVLGYGFREDPWAIKGFSLAFAFVGAAVFSLTRMKHERIPQEAIIGITYAVALAAALLAADRLAHGPTALKTLLEGSIVYVRTDTLIWTAVIYAAVGLFHWIFRRPFLMISLDPARAVEAGYRVRLWDFLFYVSFGFVVTSSVAIAGVLLVFSFLVIPAVIGVLFAERTRDRLIIGWVVGTVVSIVGGTASYVQNLPSGPAIVVTFAAALVIAGMVYNVRNAASRPQSLLRMAAGVAVVAALLGVGLLLRKDEERDVLHLLEQGTKNEQLLALKEAEARDDLWESVRPLVPGLLRDDDPEVRCEVLDLVGIRGGPDLLDHVQPLLTDPDDLVREDAIACVRGIGHPSSIDPMLDAARAEADDYLRAEMGEAVLELGDPRGIPVLIDVMDHGTRPQARRDAFEHLSAHTATGLTFDADLPPEGNDIQVRPFRDWWEEHGPRLRPGPDGKVFGPPP